MTSQDFIKYFKKTYKNRTSSFLSGLMLMIVDAISLFLCIGLSFFIINLCNPSAINFRSFIYYAYYFPLILIVYYAAGLYPGIMISPSEEVRKLTTCSIFCFFGICASIVLQQEDGLFAFTYNIVRDSSNFGVICAFILAIPITAIGMPASREIGRHTFGKSKWWGVPVVIYCTGDSGDEVISRLIKRNDLGYKPAVIINSRNTDCTMYDDIPVFPESSDILEAIKQLNIKVAIMCDYEGDKHPIMNSYRYTITVQKNQDLSSTMQLRDIGGILGFSTTHNLTKKLNLFVKRLIDLIMIFISALFVIPIMIIIAVLIKITSKGPVFYGHKRVGKNGKEITCWKFRSMYVNSQEMLEEILKNDPERREEWERDRKFVNDPRVTKFGKFLRKTSLDELPQFINILTGNMSFVGPRPVTKEELEKYGENAGYILSVTPGLSGMWQISGRSDTGYEERIYLDTFYIQNWSIWLDLWIIIRTVWVVINGKGAY